MCCLLSDSGVLQRTLSESEFSLLQSHNYEGDMSGYFQSTNSFYINYMVRNGKESYLFDHDKKILKTLRKAISGVTSVKFICFTEMIQQIF